MPSQSVVYVVDDDASVRESMEDLLRSMGREVEVFGSATEYVARAHTGAAACLVLDVNLPDINGLDLQRRLMDSLHPPIVFVSAYGDIPSTVRAMKAGAIDFLSKPFDPAQLLSAIDTAVDRHRELLREHGEQADLQARLAELTPREREVFGLVADGLLNKQAAAALGISEVTLQIHRGQVMRKMQARSFAELVRMAVRLGVSAKAEGGTRRAPPSA
jgi:FixJ family two-component response regulator